MDMSKIGSECSQNVVNQHRFCGYVWCSKVLHTDNPLKQYCSKSCNKRQHALNHKIGCTETFCAYVWCSNKIIYLGGRRKMYCSKICNDKRYGSISKNGELSYYQQYYRKYKERIKVREQQYLLKNKERIRARGKQYRLDNIERIRAYQKQYTIKHVEKKRLYDQQYRLDNKERIQTHMKQYRLDNKEELRLKHRKIRLETKLKALKSVGRTSCPYCDIHDIVLLDIHRKYGGGRKEKAVWNSSDRFYRAISRGERKTDDLEVICLNCHRRKQCGRMIGI